MKEVNTTEALVNTVWVRCEYFSRVHAKKKSETDDRSGERTIAICCLRPSFFTIPRGSFGCSFSSFNAVFPVVSSNTRTERDNNRTAVMMMIWPHDETGVRVGK